MKGIMRWAFVSLLCILSAMLLYPLQQAVNVTEKSNPQVTFSSENLVDYMQQVPLTLKKKNVKWSNNILFLDLSIEMKQFQKKYVFQDMMQLIRFSFYTTNNIHQLYVRVLFAEEHKQQLVIAMETSREDWSSATMKNNDETVEEIITEQANVTYGPLWQWISPPN
ncbi:hypothetical protein [Longirhabdus pacifica]|uniref:hypothetical protein n=1 Tax=Longirhabdus pacifica TaxID=2305227 RepID=UPI0010091722|nr:hypothetical protein [Longirhabdus pacifica]